jgi:hypothetical protein
MASDRVRTLYPGVHQENHWALDYEGAWETRPDVNAEMGRYRYAADPGSTLTFSFEGTDLWLKVGPGGDGVLSFTLDDATEESRSFAAGEQVPLVQNQPRGRHVLTIRAESGPLAVDSLTVREGTAVGPWLIAGGTLLVVVLVVLLVAGVVARRRRWYERSRVR